jgi:hypothetical protein
MGFSLNETIKQLREETAREFEQVREALAEISRDLGRHTKALEESMARSVRVARLETIEAGRRRPRRR